MNLIKLSGIKDSRIIRGQKYNRLEKTILVVNDFNSYIDSSSRAYDIYIKKAYDKLIKGVDMESDKYEVFGEIIRKRRKRSLYLTLYEKVDE